jgi:hypothetical protein
MTLNKEAAVADNSYKPGEIVKVSGIYSVVHDDGKDTFEVTCVEGEHFPPARSGKGAHFELKYAATHSHNIPSCQRKHPKTSSQRPAASRR